jgi:hypothetical protein
MRNDDAARHVRSSGRRGYARGRARTAVKHQVHAGGAVDPGGALDVTSPGFGDPTYGPPGSIDEEM